MRQPFKRGDKHRVKEGKRRDAINATRGVVRRVRLVFAFELRIH